MTLANLVMAFAANTVLWGILIWLARNLIKNRLEKSVQLEMDTKLAEVRHEFNGKLAEVQSALRAREVELASVRQTLLSNINASQDILYTRKLEAADNLYEGLLSAKKLTWAVVTISTLKVGEMSKHLNDRGMKAFIDAITKPLDVTAVTGEATWKAQKSRPWVRPMAWALFSAHGMVIGYAFAILMALKSGIKDPIKMMARDKMTEALRAALPNVNLDWDNLPDTLLPEILELLELGVLREITEMTSGSQSDAEAAARAKRVTDVTEEWQRGRKEAEISRMSPPPGTISS